MLTGRTPRKRCGLVWSLEDRLEMPKYWITSEADDYYSCRPLSINILVLVIIFICSMVKLLVDTQYTELAYSRTPSKHHNTSAYSCFDESLI